MQILLYVDNVTLIGFGCFCDVRPLFVRVRCVGSRLRAPGCLGGHVVGSCTSCVDLSPRIVSRTPSQRETQLPGCRLPRPTGSLAARVFYNGGSVPPQVSIFEMSFFLLVRQSVCPLSSRPSSAGSRALTAVGPFHHSTVLPDPDKGHFDSVDSFIR